MDRPEDARRLWAGLLAGPVGWFLAFLAVYALAAGACGQHAGRLHGLILLGLIVAGGGTVLAWRTWKAAGGEPGPKDEGMVARARLLSTLGLLGGCLFSLVIVAQWIAVAMLTACEGV
jgi:hypothetical protein